MILSGMITWWKEQMRDVVPASLRSSLNRSWRPELIAAAETADPSDITLLLRTRGGETALGRHALTGTGLRDAVARLPRAHRKATVLRTPPDLLLEQEIVLPLTAAPDLKRVVAYEMDRLTPFRAEQVFWTCLAGMRDTVRRRLHVRLTLVPRGRVEPVLAALRLAGLVPLRIEAGTVADSRRVIPLAEDASARSWLGPRIGTYALGICGVLAATAIALPFILQSIALSQLDERIDALRPQAAVVEALRKQIAGGAATADVVVAARKQVGTPCNPSRC
jgi:general secretion pathway protein L